VLKLNWDYFQRDEYTVYQKRGMSNAYENKSKNRNDL